MASTEEELQSLYAADDEDDDAPPGHRARSAAAGKSHCPKSCTAGIILLPLPCASEIRISVSPSTPTRRRRFLLALAAGNPTQLAACSGTCSNLLTRPVSVLAVYLIWQFIKNRKPSYVPFDWTPDYSVKFIPNAPLRSNERSVFFTENSPGLSCSGQMDWDPSRSSPLCFPPHLYACLYPRAHKTESLC